MPRPTVERRLPPCAWLAGGVGRLFPGWATRLLSRLAPHLPSFSCQSINHRRTLMQGGATSDSTHVDPQTHNGVPPPPSTHRVWRLPEGDSSWAPPAPAGRCRGLRPGRSRSEGDASHSSPPAASAWRGLGGVTSVVCRASTYAAWSAITAGARRAVVHPHRGHRLVRACGAQAEHSGTS